MPKFGQRIVRGLFYGNLLGFIMFLVSYFMGVAVNKLAAATVIDPIALGLAGYAMGFSAPVAVEISKEMEEQPRVVVVEKSGEGGRARG